MQRTMHINANNIALKGHVKTNDKTLEMHVSTINGMMHMHISTNKKTLKGKQTSWVFTSPCVIPYTV